MDIPSGQNRIRKDNGIILSYGSGTSPWGRVVAASTHKGLCFLTFLAPDEDETEVIKHRYPHVHLARMDHYFQELLNCIFSPDGEKCDRVTLDVKATAFQMKVWRVLIDIPFGETRTYGEVAKAIGQPGASRAVGTAIGSNPVAYFVPCHRVLRADGQIGGYKWGSELKKRILDWERQNSIALSA